MASPALQFLPLDPRHWQAPSLAGLENPVCGPRSGRSLLPTDFTACAPDIARPSASRAPLVGSEALPADGVVRIEVEAIGDSDAQLTMGRRLWRHPVWGTAGKAVGRLIPGSARPGGGGVLGEGR